MFGGFRLVLARQLIVVAEPTVSRFSSWRSGYVGDHIRWFVAWLLFAPVLPTELKGSRWFYLIFPRYASLGSFRSLLW
ncbi:hypothetical protein O9992_12925 [Vibrio lentus]|nr:hypothetical protein [Vibrio lentus]